MKDEPARRRFAFLLGPLAEAEEGSDAEDIGYMLERLRDPVGVAAVLLRALNAHARSEPSLKARASAEVTRVASLSMALRRIREAKRAMRASAPTMLAWLALLEVERELKDQLAISPIVKAARRIGPIPRGQPANEWAAELRALGVPRDDARVLLRAVRVAASIVSRRPPPTQALPVTYTAPTLIELLQSRLRR